MHIYYKYLKYTTPFLAAFLLINFLCKCIFVVGIKYILNVSCLSDTEPLHGNMGENEYFNKLVLFNSKNRRLLGIHVMYCSNHA